MYLVLVDDVRVGKELFIVEQEKSLNGQIIMSNDRFGSHEG